MLSRRTNPLHSGATHRVGLSRPEEPACFDTSGTHWVPASWAGAAHEPLGEPSLGPDSELLAIKNVEFLNVPHRDRR